MCTVSVSFQQLLVLMICRPILEVHCESIPSSLPTGAKLSMLSMYTTHDVLLQVEALQAVMELPEEEATAQLIIERCDRRLQATQL